jgi:hypothetical protein
MRLYEALQELLSQQRPLLTVPDERTTIDWVEPWAAGGGGASTRLSLT